MIRRQTAVGLALLTLALGVGSASAQDLSAEGERRSAGPATVSPESDGDESEEGSADGEPATGAPPPLRVAGTVIAPPLRSAWVVILDEQGQERGSLRVDEGDTVAGYRVVGIRTDRVSFERDGETFEIPVGRPGVLDSIAPTAPRGRPIFLPGPAPTPDLPFEGSRRSPADDPLPPNIEEAGKATE